MVKEPALTLPQSSLGPPPLSAAGYQRTIAAVVSPVGESNTHQNIAREQSQSQSHKRKRGGGMTDVHAKPGNDPTRADHSDDDEQDGGGKTKGKSRRELPAGAVATLKAWLLSPEHFTHPYPTPQDQVILMQKTGIDKKQLKNWFTNARRRIWKPMLKKQLEQGKLQATGAGGVVAIPGGVPGMVAPPGAVQPTPGAPPTPPQPGQEYGAPQAAAASVQPSELHSHYQHALQQPQQQQQQSYDVYGQSQMQGQQPTHPGAQGATSQQGQYGGGGPYYATQQSYGQQQQQQQVGAAAPAPGAPITQSNSIGSLPPIPPSGGSQGSMAAMNKTDSHAVLMELFARDQDLVRQATESARLKAQAATAASGASTAGGDTSQQQSQQHSSSILGNQHPMKMAAQGTKMGSVPSLNSWPHFSSVSSLNNLGTMTGVKSITNMSQADLASQGNLNKKGNLAQVKSMESMGGRQDSYAFLEVFFDNTGGSGGGSQGQSGQRGVKREREEDNDVGLSLDADESPSASNMKPSDASSASAPAPVPGAPRPAPLPGDGKDKETLSDSGTLKRAYDDALAARGLISVSRSCEKLTDLALPAKMQRTLSQEYLRQQMQTTSNPGQSYSGYSYSASDGQAPGPSQTRSDIAESYQQSSGDSQQYPGQNPGQQHANAPGDQTGQQYTGPMEDNNGNVTAPLSDPSMPGGTVEVPATTKCALCQRINVDTQLRPCGHMFHGRCLKPSLQNAVGPPRCPIDHITMQSAVLAVPGEEDASNSNAQKVPQPYQPNACGQTLGEPVNRKS